MNITECLDTAVEFAKDKIDRVLGFWNDLDENKKKLLIGCAIGAVSIIVVATIAYTLGKACGKRAAFEEEEF